MSRINKKIPATIKRGKSPDCFWFGTVRKPGDEVFRSLAHHFRERPILLFGNLF